MKPEWLKFTILFTEFSFRFSFNYIRPFFCWFLCFVECSTEEMVLSSTACVQVTYFFILVNSSQWVIRKRGCWGCASGEKIEGRNSAFKRQTTWGAQVGGLQSHLLPVWKCSEACLISCGTALSKPWRKVSDDNVYSSSHIPTVSSYGPGLLFLHALALLDSCEGLCPLLVAHGIPFHLSPTYWGSCKAGQV